jgi:alkanesulfonate monooxygenase SsuD/methylene tetrahydromethanopterin reductase-like flavin-dependent oxidoreductase (luciferase family)
MEFGMFHQFPALPGRTEREAFEEGFEQIDAAEHWGLDTMWLAELHFDPQRSVLSAPLSVASAIAARTERIKIGTSTTRSRTSPWRRGRCRPPTRRSG